MIAILVQYKDPQGTIFIMKPPDPKKEFAMEVVFKVETLVQSFTTFASTVIDRPSTHAENIMFCTPQFDRMHTPRLFVLNSTANDL
jgi:hypothetical protein